jgi:uncharacterized protein YjbJ (UPF0337 family)
MTDKHIDKAKGRAKEAAGALSGDKDLKARGRADQAKGAVKDAVDKAANRVSPNRPSRNR